MPLNSDAHSGSEKPLAEEELATESLASQKKAKNAKKSYERPVARRFRLLAWIRYYLPAKVHRPTVKTVRKASRVWGVNGADWHWMAHNPMPLKSLNRSLWRTAEPSFNYYIIDFIGNSGNPYAARVSEISQKTAEVLVP